MQLLPYLLHLFFLLLSHLFHLITAIPASASPDAVSLVSFDPDPDTAMPVNVNHECDSAISASSISPVMLSSSAPAIITPARSSTASSSTCTSPDSRCISPIVKPLVSAELGSPDILATPAADAAESEKNNWCKRLDCK